MSDKIPLIEFRPANSEPELRLLSEHFGPCYAEESLYFDGLIGFDQCQYVTANKPEADHEYISLLAYFVWRHMGGDSLDNWLTAERYFKKSKDLWAKTMAVFADDV